METELMQKIFSDGELEENSVIRKYWITASDGKNYNTMQYSLQMIIAVDFKVENDDETKQIYGVEYVKKKGTNSNSLQTFGEFNNISKTFTLIIGKEKEA